MPTKDEMRKWAELIVHQPNRHSPGTVAICQEWLAANPPRCAVRGAPAPKKVRVRIAVAVNESGKWSSFGNSTEPPQNQEEMDVNCCTWAAEFLCSDCGETIYFVEADLPIPVLQTIQGEVKK